jgi:hypothetical protein
MGIVRLVTTSVVLATCLAAPLTAAADTPPSQPAPPPVTAESSAPAITVAIETAIDNIRKLRDKLPKDIKTKRHEQTWFDSGLIFLGLGSVAAVLYKSTAPAIGGVALAAAGVSQYRSYYNPDAEGTAYAAAAKAARCVSSSAEPLLVVQPQLLWSAIANLKLAILQVNTSAAKLDTSPGGAGADGADAASKAVTAANSALTALNAEATAYLLSVSTIDEAHDTIKNYLEKVTHRSSIDFSTVQTQLNAAISAQASSIAQTQTARNQLAEALQAGAKAQASSGAAPAPPPVASAPQSLTAANTVQGDPAKTGSIEAKAAVSPAAAASVNSEQVSALIAATAAALQQMPSPQYTTLQTNITACTNGLA